VTAGVSNFLSPASSDVEQDRQVSSLRIHPGYVYGSENPDDVAVLTLATPLDLSGPTAQAVALPAAGAKYPAGAAVVIAGFGQQSPTASPSGQLESESGTVDPQGLCGQQQAAAFDTDNAIYLCALSPSSSVCHGDSGAGVVTTSGAHMLVAVVNDTLGCAIGKNGIHAYVGAPELLQFIKGNNTPPTAPRPLTVNSWKLSWAPPLVVGSTLTCSAGRWPGPVKVVYTFRNSVSEKVLQSGPRSSYVLPRSTIGMTVECVAAVTNSGGTTLVKTIPTFKVKQATKKS
jgi:hypothetical protein